MPTQLKPGDCLLYRPSSFFGKLIALKTWHNWSHVEIIVAPGQSVGSRHPGGVNLYPLRWSNLGMVLRPTAHFDLPKAMTYFETVKGKAYDYMGLFRFLGKGKESADKQFCSEFATRFYRAGGLDPFNGETSDLVPPFYFTTLADHFKVIWSDEPPKE